MSEKIGLIVPSTSKCRNWEEVEESYLYSFLIRSFLRTFDKEHQYVFYIGVDVDDPFYSREDVIARLRKVGSAFPQVDVKVIQLDRPKGHLTLMWNDLCELALDEGCTYIFQCGDDIRFTTRGWVNSCIATMKEHNDVGLTGPLNNNNRILTQSFVSRKHWDIFGFFFPPDIKNWCCDDWINEVYRPHHFYPLREHYCSNDGGQPRYEIDNDPAFATRFQDNLRRLRASTSRMAETDKLKITAYLEHA